MEGLEAWFPDQYGQIVEHVVNANAKSVNRLLNLTEKVFGALER